MSLEILPLIIITLWSFNFFPSYLAPSTWLGNSTGGTVQAILSWAKVLAGWNLLNVLSRETPYNILPTTLSKRFNHWEIQVEIQWLNISHEFLRIIEIKRQGEIIQVESNSARKGRKTYHPTPWKGPKNVDFRQTQFLSTKWKYWWMERISLLYYCICALCIVYFCVFVVFFILSKF